MIFSRNTSLTNKQDKLTNPLVQADVVNNLTSTATNKPLSAYQGKLLNDTLARWNGIYAHNIVMGGQRYVLVKIDREYGTYSRNVFLAFTNTGGVARCVMISVVTNNGTLAAYQEVLGNTGFNAMSTGKWSGNKPYVKIDIAGGGTYDGITFIGQVNFTLERASS